MVAAKTREIGALRGMNKKHTWPHPFLWGASTSSHQIEGNNRANDWWAWEQAGKLKEPSGLA